MITGDPFEEILAFVYLHQEGDERNVCLISANDITLIRRGKKKVVRLKDVRQLSFSKKVLLLPIVLGGVFGPFFLIAILAGYFLPAANLLGFLISIFLFYYGLSGKEGLKVETINDVLEVFLPRISENLKSFVNFANHLVHQSQLQQEAFSFFIPISEKEKEAYEREQKWTSAPEGVFGYTSDERRNKRMAPGEYFLEIDARKENIRIKFENDHNGKLRPKLQGEAINAKIHKTGN